MTTVNAPTHISMSAGPYRIKKSGLVGRPKGGLKKKDSIITINAEIKSATRASKSLMRLYNQKVNEHNSAINKHDRDRIMNEMKPIAKQVEAHIKELSRLMTRLKNAPS